MILLPYDGSADAQAAIDSAARLAPGADATVLTVWVAFELQLDAKSRDAALATVAEGAQRATAAGLVCTPRVAALDGDVASTILAVAADLDADVIAMGTRGLGAIKAFMLGSVSHAVVQDADRSVLVVPSPAVVARRRHQPDRAVASM
ncbi:MAG TPA: universal stress protein [Solirubrobacteraceae bacterium]|nr:universal stress protein [Solirubrobacteraceae bacterium]